MEINTQKMQELQLLEHQLQTLLMEKQSLQVELNEITNALEEVSKTQSEVYKVLGNIMLKADANILSKELKEKKNLLDLRITFIEKQEKQYEEKAGKLRKDLGSALQKNR